MLDLDKLEELCKAATPGPWRYTTAYGVATIESKEDRGIAHAVDYMETSNADFIAEARTALPLLIKMVRELESENDILKRSRARSS